MPEREHWIPTPEELEEGSAPDGRKKGKKNDGEAAPARRGPFRTLRMKLGVAKAREYEEVDSRRVRPEQTEEADGSRVDPQEVTKQQPARVESVRIRPQTGPTREKPKYKPHSKEAVFYRRAELKGHEMGDLVEVDRTSYTAACLKCGREGELVVQYDDNYANQTHWHVRGHAIEKTCQP